MKQQGGMPNVKSIEGRPMYGNYHLYTNTYILNKIIIRGVYYYETRNY